MSNFMVFSNQEFGQVRSLTIENKPYFVGKDVAEILGYSNTNDAIKRHCKRVVKHEGLKVNGINVALISEGDLYRLIIKSKLPKAQKFEIWVMDEVLPQIRKTGGYVPIEENMSETEIMARALMVAQNTLKKKDELLKAKEVELTEKNKFIFQIAVSQNSILVREVAKVATKNNIKIGERKLWDKLREWGLIFKNSREPKQEYVNRGYFEVVEGTKENYKGVFTYRTTRVTGKGQVYIIKKLLKEVS